MKKLVRLTSALLAVTLLSVLCAIPAAAAELSGKATGSMGYVSSSDVFEMKVGSTLSYSSLSEQSIPTSFYGAKIKAVGLGSLDLSDDGSFYTGAVGVYFSYYIYCPVINSLVSSPAPPTTRYKNHLGQDGTGDNMVKITSFTPVGVTPGAASGYTRGYAVNAQFLGSEDAPISHLRVVGSASSVIARCNSTELLYNDSEIVFASLRAVGTETSAELSELENIADSIVAQNGILTAMYGDIMAVLNAINAQTGDIIETQRLANTYLSAIKSTLETLSNTTTNIYSLLSAQFSALISAVNTASTDLQAAIAAQTAAIIAYLDALQNVTEVPGSITDATNQGNQIQNDLNGLNKPDVTAPKTEDFFTPADAQPFTDVLGNLFGSNLVVTLLLVSLSMAFVAYVLYGKE